MQGGEGKQALKQQLSVRMGWDQGQIKLDG